MSIKIGNIDISYFKVGGADCSIYIGDVKMYPTTPSSPKYVLTLSDSTTVSAECDGTSAITQAEISAYTSTTVAAEIGDCVTSIGDSAFDTCESLTNITIPNSVTSIGDLAFFTCSGLQTIDIPSGITSIGNSVFEGCSSLTNITIPNSVTSIGDGAFNKCSSLTSIEIPSGVTTIGMTAFYKCSSLTSVTVLATQPPTLGIFSFENTNNCPIYVPCESVETYKSASGWSDYASRIQCNEPVFDGKFKLTLQDSSVISAECDSTSSVTSGEVASQYSGTVISAEIGDCVTSIGNSVFANCRSLTSVNIPNSVTTLGTGAFTSCRSLTSVTIPDSVTSIGNNAFRNCTSLTSCTIGSGVTSIGNSAFYQCSGLTSVTIPDSVISIGESAFYRCSGLTSCTIGSGVTSISGYTFRDCTSLASCTIGTGVTSIERNAFDNCRSLTSIVIPDSVTSIGDSAFRYCSGLTSCTIGSGVTSIGESAFTSCSGLTSIVIPNSVTSIGDDAFKDCSGLTSCTIGNGVTRINSGAFRYCSSLLSCTIGSGVTYISTSAFQRCSGLTSVTVLATTPPDMGARTFEDSTCPIYVPCESVNAYKTAWSDYASRITCIPTPTGSTCYEVISDPITAYTATTYDSVYSFADLKWYMKNNLNAYEEYGVYDVVEDISSATTYEGKLGVVGETEYQYSGGSWTVVGTYEDSSITYEITDEDQYEYQGVELSTTFKIPYADVEALGGWLDMGIRTQNSSYLEIETDRYSLGSEQGTVTSDSDYYYYSLPNTQSIIIDRISYWESTPIHIIVGSKQISVEYQEKDIPTAKAYQSVADMEADTCPTVGVGQFGVVGNNVYQFNDNEEWDTFNNVRFIGRYSGGTTNVLECDSSSAITSADTKPAYISAEITSAVIGDCVTNIGEQAFNRCNSLTSITIPNSVTSIGGDAFYSCSSLTSVTIPNSVTTIGNSAFRDCSGVTSVTIGSGVTNIAFAAFDDCPNLTSVTVNATTPPELGFAVFDSTCPIYVPSASVDAYKSASSWSTYKNRIQAIPNS